MAEQIPGELMQWGGGTETTFGAGGASNPAAGDAFDHLSADVGALPMRVILQNDEKSGYRTKKAGFQGWFDPRQIKMSIYAKGSGVATTQVDYAFLFKAAGFTETVGGSSVSYARSGDPTSSNISAWLWGVSSGGEIGKSISGAIMTQIALTAENESKIEFTGEAAKSSVIYKTTLGSTISISDPTITLSAGHGWVVEGAPVYFQIDSEIFKGASISGNVVTLSGTASAGHTAGVNVTAYGPSRTVSAADPLSSVLFSFDLNAGSEDIQYEKIKVDIKTGMKLLDKEAGEAYRTGYIGENPGADAARYTVDMHYTVGASSVAKLAAYAAGNTSKSALCTLGTATGNIITIASTDARIPEPPNAPEPDSGPVKATFIFQGHSASGADIAIVTK